ncbi:hypothetical protein [uncultured Jatrophihabitans sp.]|uniref:hypothetical protein n=1 Tax=uncultured Jatrophihabitans sp. TaxID=1610747 RepID=UPI0035CAC437
MTRRRDPASIPTPEIMARLDRVRPGWHNLPADSPEIERAVADVIGLAYLAAPDVDQTGLPRSRYAGWAGHASPPDVEQYRRSLQATRDHDHGLALDEDERREQKKREEAEHAIAHQRWLDAQAAEQFEELRAAAERNADRKMPLSDVAEQTIEQSSGHHRLFRGRGRD